MIVRLHPHSTPAQKENVRRLLLDHGLSARPLAGFAAPVFAVDLDAAHQELDEAGELAFRLEKARAQLAALPGVAAVGCDAAELTRRALRPEGTRVRVGGVEIGGGEFAVIAGPCSVESEEQISATARAVAAAGAHLLRGGAYKPRTSTYSFQGLGPRGLRLLAAAGREAGLGVVTEVLDTADVDAVAEHADMLQVGARNMQNFALLKRLGELRKPVLLKRGAGATLLEWLAAAEYLLARGNDQVVLCERGIRTFETYTRNTLDIAAVPAIHELSHLPVLVDPSHATGRRSLLAATSRAALAVGADGLCLEVHIRPAESVSDREQALAPDEFAAIMQDLRPLAAALRRGFSAAARRPERELPAREEVFATA